jgi:hypothetical protein
MTRIRLLGLLLPAALVAGCGSMGNKAANTRSATTIATSPSTTGRAATTTASAPGALQAEANTAAAGDIPDNQVFLLFTNPRARYSMKYPEGWAQQGTGAHVTFRDKNNIVRVVVGAGRTPTPAAVRADLRAARLASAPQSITIDGKPAIKVTYTTRSAPSPVTGKRVTLSVDRYYLANSGRRAVVDLGTPVGVDNVDAYRLMIESFRWR